MSQHNNTAVFETMSVPKAVRTMAVPTIIGQLIILVYSIADTFFIGRTNNPFMVAGASLILPIFNISLSLAGLTGVGGGALISRLLGKHDEAEARKVFNFSILFSVSIAAMFSLVTFVLRDPLMNLLGADADTHDYALSYALCVIVAGGIPTVMTNVLSVMMRSVGDSRKAGFGVTMGGVINIALDPLFMFVLMPEGMEIIGAGIATCLSNIISCLYFVIAIRRLEGNTVLRLTSPKNLPSGRSILNIFAVGIPSCITTLLFDIDYIVIDKLMALHDNVALAAVGIVLKAERLPLNIGLGICQGMLPIVAYNYSARNYRRMNQTIRFSLILGIICAVASISLYEIFSPFIMRFFIDDPGTVALGTDFLRARSLATLFMFLSFFHVYLFNSYGKGGYSLMLGIMRWVCFNIPLLFVLNAFFGATGIVWAQLVGDVLTVTLSVVIYRLFARRHFRKSDIS